MPDQSSRDEALKALGALAQAVIDADPDFERPHSTFLDVTPTGDGIAVYWYIAHIRYELETAIWRGLASHQIAPWLTSVEVVIDEQWNPSPIIWSLDRIAEGETVFGRLRTFSLTSKGSIDDDITYEAIHMIRGKDEHDDTVVERLFSRMPALECLSLPEPPQSVGFFEGPVHPLRRLAVLGVGQFSFIDRLKDSRRFPYLVDLDLSEGFQLDFEVHLHPRLYEDLLERGQFSHLNHLRIVNAGFEESNLGATRLGQQVMTLDIRPVDAGSDAQSTALVAGEMLDDVWRQCTACSDAWECPAERGPIRQCPNCGACTDLELGAAD